MTRYRLRQSIEPFPAPDGALYLLRAGGGRDLVVRTPDDADRVLTELLARRALSEEEALGALQVAGVAIDATRLREKLSALSEAGLTVEAPTESEERFARQLPYLLELDESGRGQARLRAASVLIIGCGGLGTWALAALASLGVGRFVVVDHDTVELSNLNRQILFGAGDLGRHKVELAAEWARGFDPAIALLAVTRKVAGERDVAELLPGNDVVVLAADWPPYELGRWVNRACVDAGLPFLLAGQIPPILKIGPTYVPRKSACFECHERMLRRNFPLYDALTAYRRDHPTDATTLGPGSGMVGSLLAMEVLHLLMGRDAATEGRALLVDMATLETRWEPIERDPRCPVCGAG